MIGECRRAKHTCVHVRAWSLYADKRWNSRRHMHTLSCVCAGMHKKYMHVNQTSTSIIITCRCSKQKRSYKRSIMNKEHLDVCRYSLVALCLHLCEGSALSLERVAQRAQLVEHSLLVLLQLLTAARYRCRLARCNQGRDLLHCGMQPDTQHRVRRERNILRAARVACTMRATRGHAGNNPRACGREGGNLAIFASASSALVRHSSIVALSLPVDMACSRSVDCSPFKIQVVLNGRRRRAKQILKKKKYTPRSIHMCVMDFIR